MIAEDLGALATEASDPRYARLDQMSVAELAQTMNEADATVPAAVQRALPQIVPAIEQTAARMAQGGRLVYVGAGTPDASGCSTPPNVRPRSARRRSSCSRSWRAVPARS